MGFRAIAPPAKQFSSRPTQIIEMLAEWIKEQRTRAAVAHLPAPI